MSAAGLGGKVGWVDLTRGKVWTEESQIYKEFVGGRGVGSFLVFREVPVGADPLGRHNILTFDTGPLTGTLAPSCGRLSISTKNVLTGGISWANSGGHFAPALKFAGFDHLVITGQASKPVYIFVHEGEIEIRDALKMWGTDVWETEDLIREELDNRKVHIAAIGQAGENLVRGACIIIDRGRAAAWGGCGAVMGSKKLKAVVACGTGRIELDNPSAFVKKAQAMWQIMDRSHLVGMLRRYGTLGAYGAGGIDGSVPQSCRNMEDEVWDAEKTMKVREITFKEKYEVKRLANFGCPAYCSHFYHVRDGQFSGLKLEGLQTNTYRAVGTNLDVDSPTHILKANELLNRYGINVDEASATIGWAIDCFERGLIDEKITGGLTLRWGDGDVVLELIRMITFRQGFGNILAEGVYRAAEQVGNGTEKYVMHVKGAGMSEQGVRSHKGWALGIMTSVRGGSHLAGTPNTEQKGISSEVSQSLFGVETAGKPTVYSGKGKVVRWFEMYKPIVDMVGLCTTTSQWSDLALMTADDYAELIMLVTGWPVDGNKLMLAGDRVYNIEKAFNTLHAGFTRKDDYPPWKLTAIPISGGKFAGERLEIDKWDEMLDEYYSAHDWDTKTGWQKRSCLEALELPFVAKRLEQAGRLIEDRCLGEMP